MLEDSTRFQAIDEAALLTTLADTEICRKKVTMYQQLAVNPTVKRFFADKAGHLTKIENKLRKMLKVPVGSQWK
jgi:hypothetical protein